MNKRIDKIPKEDLLEITRDLAHKSLQVQEMIKSVRTYEEVMSGKRTIHLESIGLKFALMELQNRFKEQLKEKDLEIEINQTNVNLDEVFILADPTTLIFSVFGNILSNAIKFSTAGSKIRIEVEVEPQQNTVSMAFVDEGPGIPAELLSEIFNFSAKTTRTGTQGEKGSGFEMPILKQFVDSYKGSIAISSSTQTHDHGTRVTVKLKKGENVPLHLSA